jgi:uncharacterized membrane protein
MTPILALYILLGLAAALFFVWVLITYVVKASPGKEIVIGVAVLLLLLVLLHELAPFFKAHGW